MQFSKPLVDKQVILDLLYGDEDYVSEFATASVESFSEFKKNFKKSMMKRDEKSLRNAGHKIKPVAQMMKLDPVITMYETSKIYIEEDASDDEIQNLVERMDTYCSELIEELKEFR